MTHPMNPVPPLTPVPAFSIRPGLRRIARAFTAIYLLQTLLAAMPAAAQMTAAPGAPSGQKPLIDAAANGVPLVLIAPPSAGGVSRNQFNQFNVAPAGVVLNNATGNAQTQLGGWIKGNLQLGATPARIILNEVTGPNASQLRGVIEVGGQRADVVVANPNGITCDGCGFLNANRATLATGLPVFGAGGALAGFDVRAGVLNIGAGGLSATGQQQLDLYARGLVVEGELWAQNLQAVIGANQVSYGATGALVQIAPGIAEGAVPRFAVDVKALGGMYAGSIYLIATDKGLGVNSAGRLATLAGNLMLSARGDLTVKDVYAAGSASLVSAGQVSLAGQGQAEASFSLRGQGVRTAGGTVFAPVVVVDAGTGVLDNAGGTIQATSSGAGALGVTAAGVQNAGGAIYAQSDLTLAAGPLDNRLGAIVSQGVLAITTGNQLLTNDGGVLQGKGNVTLDSGAAALGNVGGAIVAGGNASIRAGTLDTHAAAGSAAGQAGITAGGLLDIAAAQLQATGAALVSGGAMNIGVVGLANLGGAAVDAGGKLTLQAEVLQAPAARVAGNGDIDVTTSSGAGIAGGTWSAQGSLAINSGGALDAANSNLRAGMDLTAQAAGISTAAADVLVRNLTLDARSGALNNAVGKLQATGTTRVAAQGVNNAAGTIAGNGDVFVDAGTGTLNNAMGALYSAQSQVSATAALTSNAGGLIGAASTLSLQGGAVDNAGGVISGARSVAMRVRGLANDAGVVEAGTDGLVIDTQGQALRNAASGTMRGIVSAGDMSISAGSVGNASSAVGGAGYIGAAGHLGITATGNIDNAAAAVITAGTTSLSATGDVVNAGLINSTAGETSIAAVTLRNTGRIYGDSVAITGATVNSANAAGLGAVIASRAGDVVMTGPVSNTGGSLIFSMNDLTIHGAVTNDGSTINAARHLSIAGALSNNNAGLQLGTVTRPGSTTGFYIRPANSTSYYTPEQLRYSTRDSGFWVLPSTTYSFERFGFEARPLMSSCVDRVDDYPLCGNFYTLDDPIWSLMNVAPPGPAPAAPPAGCTADIGGGNTVRVITGSCGTYWAGVDTWQGDLPGFHARLDAAITAFNDDLASRNVNNWFETTVTAQTVVETAVTSSKPGQVLAGGNMTLGGGINQDSIIVAGGNLDGGGLQNVATQGSRQTTQDGTEVYSWGEHRGGLNGTYRRNREAPQPIANAPVLTTFALPTVTSLAGTAPSSVVTPAGLPAEPADSTGTAMQSQLAGSVIAAGERARQQGTAVPPGGAAVVKVAAGSLPPAQAADTRARREIPVKGEGFLTVTAQGVVRVPGSQLFNINRAPAARFLVETDPAFAGYRNWLSSDYVLGQLALDADRSFKRYGDGFAEQRLVDDQILALTGRRFLSGYSATESECQDLLDAGVQFAQAFRLSPGVALSAAQMASLTTDIVWLELKAVAMPDGSTAQVLVPVVYLRRPVEGDLTPSGSLIAGGNVTLRSAGDIGNSGTIFANGDAALGGGKLSIQAGNIASSGTLAGNTVGATATGTINVAGGVVQGTGAASTASLNARDIILRTTTQTTSREVAGVHGLSTGTGTNVDRVATIRAGDVTLAALNNIDLHGASVSATVNLKVTAGGSITSDAVKTGYTLNIPLGGNSQARTGYVDIKATTQQITTLQAGGNLDIDATGNATFTGTNADAGGSLAVRAQNITADAAIEKLAFDQQGVKRTGYDRYAQSDESLAGGNFSAGKDATFIANGTKADGQGNISLTGGNLTALAGQARLSANNNIVVQNATTEHGEVTESYASAKGFMSSSSTERAASNEAKRVQGSGISGATVDVGAGGDLLVKGSNVVSDTKTTLTAAGKVTITAANGTQTTSDFTEQKKSGFGAMGGLSYGNREQTTRASGTTSRATASNIGSLHGDVNIAAGATYTQTGSNVVAPEGDVTIRGQKVRVTEARETTSSESEQKFKESGIAVTFSNPLITALENTTRMDRQSDNTSDPRMKALAGAAAAGSVKNAIDAVAADAANAGGVGINFSLGTKKQQSSSNSLSNTAAGSTVAAGGNVSITATGSGLDSNVLVQGSKISAGRDASVKADGKVNFEAAENTSEQHTSSKGSSASIGVG
ncbi:MAG: filamentous hemagglutinin N-terminal domain-containing protein, partial [Burkholderiales bacterium]